MTDEPRPQAPSPIELTQLLHEATDGSHDAASRLFEVVYSELRALAGARAGGFDANHTMQPTALVHEAFVKLLSSPGLAFNDRSHFFAIAATAMRQLLADHARRKRALRRGGGATAQQPTEWDRLALDPAMHASAPDADAIALDELLQELARADERRYRVVELRFFGGLTVEQVAEHLGVSRSTVEADWRVARAWLASRLAEVDSPG